MSFTRETAQNLMAAINQCAAGLCSTLPALEQELTPDEFKVMKREIGRILGVMDSSVSAKVSYYFPDLATDAAPLAHPIIQSSDSPID